MKNEGGESNNSGIASVILGLLSVTLFFLGLPAIILGLTGLIFSIVQFKTSKNKWAVWGLILSLLGLILSIIVLIALFVIASHIANLVNQVSVCTQNPSLPECEQFTKQFADNLLQNIKLPNLEGLNVTVR